MKPTREQISVFFALLFHASGLIGILFTSYRDWFIQYTPLNLLLMAALLIWNQRTDFNRMLLFAAIAFTVGMVTEIIGVNTGLLFGRYAYTKALGPGLKGVPWLIGVNWFVVVYCCGTTLNKVNAWAAARMGPENRVSSRMQAVSLLIDGALLAVLFDWLMEPGAVSLGFWRWTGNVIPSFNYICWFVISVILLALFRRLNFGTGNHFAVHLLLIEALFFCVLRIYL
jgi:putative membrane protein